MARVFISYKRDCPDEEFARRLERALAGAGHEPWRDDGRIAPGQVAVTAALEAAHGCDFMAVVVSRHSVGSSPMGAEISTFMSSHGWQSGRLVPLRLDQTLPGEVHVGLATARAGDFRSDFDGPFRELLGTLRTEAAPTRDELERRDLAIELALAGGRAAMAFYNPERRPNHPLDDRKNSDTEADQASQEKILEGLARHPAFGREPVISEGSEASHALDPGPGYTWVIDPLDGTTNFRHRIPLFCTAIGVLKDGAPFIGVVYDPLRDEVYSAIEGEPTRWRLAHGTDEVIRVSPTVTRMDECVAATHVSSRPRQAERLLGQDLLLDVAKRVLHLRAFGCGQLALAFLAAGRIQLFFQFGSYPWDQAAGVALIRGAGGVVAGLAHGKPWRFGDADFAAAANAAIESEFLQLLASRDGRLSRPR